MKAAILTKKMATTIPVEPSGKKGKITTAITRSKMTQNTIAQIMQNINFSNYYNYRYIFKIISKSNK